MYSQKAEDVLQSPRKELFGMIYVLHDEIKTFLQNIIVTFMGTNKH